MKKFKIIIGGDLVINDPSFPSSGVGSELIDLFNEGDLRILNLESPLCDADNSSRIFKTGPHLKGDIEAMTSVMKSLNIDLVTLANNHIMDYGKPGLEQTLEHCNDHNIDYVGAGMDLQSARQPYLKEINGQRLAIINIAENEWSSASEGKAGAAGIDLIQDHNLIRETKKIADHILVIVHGGHEHYSLPSPDMQKRYRFYADSAADMVIGHHPHCISGYEIYKEVPIYYSLGNFLFTTPKKKPDSWNTGLVLNIDVTSSGNISSEEYFVKYDFDSKSLNLVQGSALKELEQDFAHLNDNIRDAVQLKHHWQDFVSKKRKSYLNYWHPSNYIQNRYVKKMLQLMPVSFEKGKGYHLNLIRCESHQELSKTVMEQHLADHTDS